MLKNTKNFYREYKANQIKQRSAVLTYYGFIALFPLALFSMTILNLLLPKHSQLSEHFFKALSQVIPSLGNQFFHNLNYNRSIGIWMATELVLVLVGSTALINELRLTLNQIWHKKLPLLSKWQALKTNSLLLLLMGLSVLTMVGVIYGDLFVFHGSWLSIASLIAACLLNGLWWLAIFRVAIIKSIPMSNFWPAAIVTGIVLQLMARFGGFILSYELKHLSSLYGSSALILGILIWIYIQVHLIFIISEINLIRLRRASPELRADN
ncbi:MAG TPA: YhjD/YihY/BrkB family envelope integrity protein [Candidatus Saccharimonadales bacterium]|jgi:YihY family inner membrane protein